MTEAEARALPPRELDALVAEKVMGYGPKNDPCHAGEWSPSTSISAAWEVVENMKEDGDVFIEWWQDDLWTVSNKPIGVRDNGVILEADTAPLAICLAALKAVGAIR